MSRGTAWARAGLVLGAVLAVDQLSKRVIASSVSPGDSRPVLPGVELVHVTNRGVAFGVLAGHTAVSVVVGASLAGLVAYFAWQASRPLLWLPTGLLLGGAMGNVIDRVRDGAVTDFIKVPLWPAFNLADAAITIGVVALLYVLEEGARGARRPARE
jgi:signal peptidase II